MEQGIHVGLFKIAAEVPLAFQSVCTFTCAPSAMAANLFLRDSLKLKLLKPAVPLEARVFGA